MAKQAYFEHVQASMSGLTRRNLLASDGKRIARQGNPRTTESRGPSYWTDGAIKRRMDRPRPDLVLDIAARSWRPGPQCPKNASRNLRISAPRQKQKNVRRQPLPIEHHGIAYFYPGASPDDIHISRPTSSSIFMIVLPHMHQHEPRSSPAIL
jgi:hypothetical protein